MVSHEASASRARIFGSTCMTPKLLAQLLDGPTFSCRSPRRLAGWDRAPSEGASPEDSFRHRWVRTCDRDADDSEAHDGEGVSQELLKIETESGFEASSCHVVECGAEPARVGEVDRVRACVPERVPAQPGSEAMGSREMKRPVAGS